MLLMDDSDHELGGFLVGGTVISKGGYRIAIISSPSFCGDFPED